MRISPLAAAIAATLPLAAFAEDAASPFSGKVAIYSEYEYRGISQSSEKPAAQLNLDYAHASGFYVGTFLSNIRWIKDTARQLHASEPNANLEWDLYGGYRHEFHGVTLDVGYLRYEYPSAPSFAPALLKPNTNEIYAGVGWGPAFVKYSRASGTLFGVPGSKGSDYLEATLNQPVMERLTINATVGRQRYKGTQFNNFPNDLFSYTVYKAGATWNLGRGWHVGGYYKSTTAGAIYYTLNGKDFSRDRAVGFVDYSF